MENYRFPSGGRILGLAFELFGLVDALSEPLRKALQRARDDSPTGASLEKREELVGAFETALLGAREASLSAAALDYLSEWDQLAFELNSLSARPEVQGLCAYPLIRLAAIDLALRCAAARVLELTSSTDPSSFLVAPEIDPVWLHRDALARVIDHFRYCTHDELEREVGVESPTLARWRDGSVKPRSKHLGILANVLAGRGRDSSAIERLLRTAVASQEALQQLDQWLGEALVDDLLGAMRHIGNRAVQVILSRGSLGRAALEDLALKGARASGGGVLLQGLAEMTRHRGVREDLLSLAGSWTGRTRYWLQQMGNRERLLVAIEQRLGPVPDPDAFIAGARQMLLTIGDPFTVPAGQPDLGALKADPQFRANQLHERALSAFQRDDFRATLALLQEAVRLDPDNAEHHYRLGALIGAKTASTNLAIGHLGLAAALRPGWPQPPTEIGIVLSNDGHTEEAENAFAKVEPVAGSWDHFHYVRGVNAMMLPDLDLAEHCFREALTRNDARDDARACLVLVFERSARSNTSECRELKRMLEKRMPGRWRETIPGNLLK